MSYLTSIELLLDLNLLPAFSNHFYHQNKKGWSNSQRKTQNRKSLYTILQILSLTLFEQVPIFQALTDGDYKDLIDSNCKQLDLFDF